MAEATKDTIYIDIDDEITGIIDKVSQSKHKIVALVLPKRASVLQSIVNMKLLKRSGDTHKKKIVLITSEAGLLPLAGAVKLHVAKTLQSKPTVPAAPDVPSDNVALDDSVDDITAIDEDDDDIESDVVEDKKLDTKKAVGELAGAAAAKPVKSQQFEETIDIDDEPELEAAAPVAAAKKASKKDKKLKIPDFNQFRTKLLVGGGLVVLLLIGWYVSSFVLPTAKITVITDSVSVSTDVAVTLSTDAKAIDKEKLIVPATAKSIKKTDAEKVPATGKKNVGEQAKGTVSLRLTDCSKESVTVPSGTIVTSGGLNFILQKDVTFIRVLFGSKCNNQDFPAFTTATINVVAQNSGDQYNISGGRTFSVVGFSNVAGYDSSSMTGGTNKEVTVVSQEDIDAATQKLTDKSKDAAIKELTTQLKDNSLYAIAETVTVTPANITASPTVGAEATEITVTNIVTYTLLGVDRDDLKSIIVDSAKEKIDTKEQTISNDGLDDAVIKATDQISPTQQKLSIQTTVSTGAQEEQDSLKTQIAGKKKGEVQQLINARAGVKEVQVSYSPFWVYKTPSNPKKITIVYQQASNGQDK